MSIEETRRPDAGARQRVAVVGTGVSGLVAAWLLHRRGHEVTVFESDDRIGGHVNTVDVEVEGRTLAVDTGFIVHNDRTYPNFVALLDELGVARRDSDMSFAVSCARTGLEYNGHSLDTLFAQRRNLLRPAFWRLVADILRFFREGRELVAGTGGLDPWAGRFGQAERAPGAGMAQADGGPTLGELVARGGYGRLFAEHFLLPMGAAIWSSPPDRTAGIPAAWLLRFFDNHGMLTVEDRPVWKVIEGGSRAYVGRLAAALAGRLRVATPVARVERFADRVELVTAAGERARFDRVVLACHAPEALGMLADATPAEREVLGAMRTQRNDAVLHHDARLMPRTRRAWAAWNVQLPRHPAREGDPVAVTYWMNRLQGLPVPTPILVTLNRDDEIDPAKVWRRVSYRHPEFSRASVAAQRRWAEIDGANRTHFCGAYWGWGFHEDGVKSALAVARRFGIRWPDEQVVPLGGGPIGLERSPLREAGSEARRAGSDRAQGPVRPAAAEAAQ